MIEIQYLKIKLLICKELDSSLTGLCLIIYKLMMLHSGMGWEIAAQGILKELKERGRRSCIVYTGYEITLEYGIWNYIGIQDMKLHWNMGQEITLSKEEGGARIFNYIIKAKIDLAKSTLVELSNEAKQLVKVLWFSLIFWKYMYFHKVCTFWSVSMVFTMAEILICIAWSVWDWKPSYNFPNWRQTEFLRGTIPDFGWDSFQNWQAAEPSQ